MMWDRLGPTMRRALAATRASDTVEATRLLQEALQVAPAHKASQGQTRDGSTAARVNSTRPRRGLAETLSALRREAPMQPGKPHREPPLEPGTAFVRKVITTSAGQREYTLFVPSRAKPKGLVVMLHGCQQTAEDFACGTAMNRVAEREGMLVAYPTQPRTANVSGCWNWFEPDHQARDAGEPHIIAEMTRTIIADYKLGPRVYAAGLSAGGAMAAVMGTTYPDLFEAIGIHSGLPYRSAHDVNSAFAAMRGTGGRRSSAQGARVSQALPRQIVFHGTHDKTVVLENAHDLMETLRRAHADVRVEEQRFEAGSRTVLHIECLDADNGLQGEAWIIEGAGHYWSGGNPAGSYAKADGPDASQEMMRFFLGRRWGH